MGARARGRDDDGAATAAADALVGWLQDRYGGRVALVEPPSSKDEGFDSAIHLVSVRGDALPDEWQRPLVLRVKSGADRSADATREATIHAWLAGHGYPAPRVLRVFEPGELLEAPVQAMERVPGVLMADQALRRPWQTRMIVRQLASLQVRLHQLPPDGLPTDHDLLDRRLLLSRRTADACDDTALREGLALVLSMADELRDAPVSACHGDFHPLNVLVADGQASVIDWTDAGLGDRHGDVARTIVLFESAAIAATNELERSVLRSLGPVLGRRYRRSYERELPLEQRRLALWRPVHLLHGWSQALAWDAESAGRRTETEGRMRPDAVGELRHRFQDAMEAVSGWS